MPIDVTLINEMLRLTPVERLRQNDRVAKLVVKLQEAFANTPYFPAGPNPVTEFETPFSNSVWIRSAPKNLG